MVGGQKDLNVIEYKYLMEVLARKWHDIPPILHRCTCQGCPLPPVATEPTGFGYLVASKNHGCDQSLLFHFLLMILFIFFFLSNLTISILIHLLVLSKFGGNIEHTTTWGVPLQSYLYSVCINKEVWSHFKQVVSSDNMCVGFVECIKCGTCCIIY